MKGPPQKPYLLSSKIQCKVYLYHESYLCGTEMKVKKLLPVDMESKRLIDWLEKGESQEPLSCGIICMSDANQRDE